MRAHDINLCTQFRTRVWGAGGGHVGEREYVCIAGLSALLLSKSQGGSRVGGGDKGYAVGTIPLRASTVVCGDCKSGIKRLRRPRERCSTAVRPTDRKQPSTYIQTSSAAVIHVGFVRAHDVVHPKAELPVVDKVVSVVQLMCSDCVLRARGKYTHTCMHTHTTHAYETASSRG